MSKREYLVSYIDKNGVAQTESYSASDLISLFMVIAKESIHREMEWGLKRITIEDITDD